MTSSRERAERMYEDDPLRYANEASDHGWSVITGMCGGCGTEECHSGACRGGHCDRCPTRKAQGFRSILADSDGAA